MSLELSVAQILGTYGGGGAERVTFTLGRGLHELGVQSICVALRKKGKYAEADTSGMEVLELGLQPSNPLHAMLAASRLRKLIVQRRLTLLHVHGQNCLALSALALMGMRQRPRLWFTWHVPDAVVMAGGWRSWLMLWALRRCEVIYGDSKAIVEQIARVPGLARKARVFKNAVPLSPMREPGNGEEPVVLWLARLVPTKDPQILVRVAARLKADGLRFRVVMAGSAPSYLAWFVEQTRQLACRLNVADIVSFPGWIDSTDALIQSSDIGVQTSHAEGLSLTLLEQMMAGLAVVATNVGDTDVAVEHGKTGLLVPPADEEKLYQAIKLLLVDGSLREKLGLAARDRAIAEFSMKAMAERTVRDYAQSLSSLDTSAT